MKTLNEIEKLEKVIKHKESVLEYAERMLNDQLEFLDCENNLNIEQIQRNIWEIRNFISNNLYTNGQENF
jgi:hypothetical protein